MINKELNSVDLLQNENIDRKLKNVKVSVIVATYRRDASLKKALESLINQSYDNIEIIVVDDNAEEKWNEKVKNIIDKIKVIHDIIYIKNELNKGSAETRNIGIKVASGEYITFLDDDDIYLSNKIKNQIEHMIENKSDYSVTDLNLYNENERLIEHRNRRYIKENNKESLFKYHFMYHITGTDTLMFKKNYLLNIGGFPLINVGDEFYLVQRAIEEGGRFSYLPLCDVKAYVHTQTNGLSSGENKIKGENRLYEYKKKYFDCLDNTDIRYIKMRHYAVLAFAEIRRKNVIRFIKYTIYSFINSPIQCSKLVLSRKKFR